MVSKRKEGRNPAQGRKRRRFGQERQKGASKERKNGTFAKEQQRRLQWIDESKAESLSSPPPSKNCATQVCEDDDGVGQACCIMSSAEEDLSRLPWHLILARLPVRKLCQLRCVCKAWNLMLGGVVSSPGDSCIDGNDECWFITARSKHDFKTWDFVAYSSRTSPSQQQSSSFTPFPLPLPNPRYHELCSLLSGGDARRHRHSSRLVRTMDIPPLALASMGGLMCALVRGGQDAFFLVVFNCLTGSLKVLPPPHNPHHVFRASWKPPCCMTMASDSRDSSRHYIMLTRHIQYVHDSDLPLHLEVYDSKHESWKVGCSVDLVTAAGAGLPLWDGDFFFLILHSTTMSVAAYHVVHDAWSTVQAPKRTCSEADMLYAVLKYNRRVLVAQPLTCCVQDIHMCRGFGVWELQFSASSKVGTWVEVSRTPQHLCLPLPLSDWTYNLLTGGSFFCMVFKEWDDLEHDLKKGGRSRPPLVFDVARNSWYSVPVGTKLDCILVHQPRLSARV